MKPAEADQWCDFERRLPWLNRSHRALMEIASTLAAKMAAGVLGVPGLNLLRLTLGQLGATPATAHKVSVPEPPEEDPADKYFR